MSANNWRTCPQCLARAKVHQQNLRDRAARAYGKVPRDKYEAMCRKASEPISLEEEFREDWDIGTDDHGDFYVRYRGNCQRCGLTHEFKHDSVVKMKVGPDVVPHQDDDDE